MDNGDPEWLIPPFERAAFTEFGSSIGGKIVGGPNLFALCMLTKGTKILNRKAFSARQQPSE